MLSHYPRFRAAALAEAGEVMQSVEVEANLDPDLTLISGETPEDVDWSASVFVQHVAPADLETPLSGARSDLDTLTTAWVGRVREISSPFSVQCRRASRSGGQRWATASYSSRDVEVAVGSALQDHGVAADTDTPHDVVSICLGGEVAWSGLSPASSNVRRLGPLHPRNTQPWEICRAERKLIEAVELWGLESSLADSQAIDLGASPGGWTWVLAEAGAHVTAVDPGNLSDAVAAHARVEHRRQRFEDFAPEPESFDWLVNDMNIDPPDVLAALDRAHSWLRPAGRVVCTLKLASKTSARLTLADFVSRLAPLFALDSARHLYSNRQEVTLLLRRLPG